MEEPLRGARPPSEATSAPRALGLAHLSCLGTPLLALAFQGVPFLLSLSPSSLSPLLSSQGKVLPFGFVAYFLKTSPNTHVCRTRARTYTHTSHYY